MGIGESACLHDQQLLLMTCWKTGWLPATTLSCSFAVGSNALRTALSDKHTEVMACLFAALQLHAHVQVCDFNLSRVMEESAILSSMAASNPRWLAPEILSGRGYTFSSDVYSFGVIMWEFLTWQIPWHECGPWQVQR